MDFDDLLLNVNILFRDFPDALEKYQNHVRLHSGRRVSGHELRAVRRSSAAWPRTTANVCVVGDDAQSIYSFRGAKIENILRFQQRLPRREGLQARAELPLDAEHRERREQHHREEHEADPQEVVLRRAIRARRSRCIKAYTDKEEASLIAVGPVRRRARQRRPCPTARRPLLYRTNAQSRALEEALRNRNIPYKIYGGVSFYQRKEIKDLLAYVRLVVNPKDDEAFRRIVNYPPSRGIGDVTLGPDRRSRPTRPRGEPLGGGFSTLPPEEHGAQGSGAAKKDRASSPSMIAVRCRRCAPPPSLYDHGAGDRRPLRASSGNSTRCSSAPEAVSALENIRGVAQFDPQTYTDEQRAEESPQESSTGRRRGTGVQASHVRRSTSGCRTSRC